MSDFRNYLNKQLEDPEFRAEWDALQPEMGIVQAEAQIRAYSDANRKGATCFCVTPIRAEKILREFYGLPENGGKGSSSGGGKVLDLADFFG